MLRTLMGYSAVQLPVSDWPRALDEMMATAVHAKVRGSDVGARTAGAQMPERIRNQEEM